MQEVLLALLLAGTMGMIGQGARAIVGLKTLSDTASSPNATNADVFNAARLLVSLMIGFIAGVGSAFLIGLDKVEAADAANTQVLFGLAGAGYVGVDAIEGFLAKYLPGKGDGERRWRGLEAYTCRVWITARMLLASPTPL